MLHTAQYLAALTGDNIIKQLPTRCILEHEKKLVSGFHKLYQVPGQKIKKEKIRVSKG